MSRCAVLRLAIALATVGMSMAGCAGRDQGSALREPPSPPVTSEIARRTGFAGANWLRPLGPYMQAVVARVEELREQPMSEAAAVETAMLNDAAVQGRLQEYGTLRAGLVVELADLARARGGKGDTGVDWLLIGRAIALPRYVESNTGEEGEREPVGVWDADFTEGYLELAETVLAKAHAARAVFYDAVAASQVAAVLDRVLETAKAGAELADEQYRSGTLSRLDRAKEQLAYAEAHKTAAKARQAALEAREGLNRELLLHGQQTVWALPDQLPALPAERPMVPDPEGLVLREGVEAVAARAAAGSFTKGVLLRSEAREAHAAMLAAYDLARFQQDTVMPASAVMMEEQQLHYNAMVDDVFHLLEAARERLAAEREQVETLAEFWKARARFAQLAGGRLDLGGEAATKGENKS